MGGGCSVGRPVILVTFVYGFIRSNNLRHACRVCGEVLCIGECKRATSKGIWEFSTRYDRWLFGGLPFTMLVRDVRRSRGFVRVCRGAALIIVGHARWDF